MYNNSQFLSRTAAAFSQKSGNMHKNSCPFLCLKRRERAGLSGLPIRSYFLSLHSLSSRISPSSTVTSSAP